MGALDMREHYQLKAEHNQNLVNKLKTKKDDELTDELIKVSENLQNVKIDQLKSKRYCEEKDLMIKHMDGLLKQRSIEVNELEKKFAEAEHQFRKKEQKFRSQDN